MTRSSKHILSFQTQKKTDMLNQILDGSLLKDGHRFLFVLEQMKKNDNLYNELKKRTPGLNGLYLAHPYSQRLYHYVHKMSRIPRLKSGWYCKFLGFQKGYSTSKRQDIRNSEWEKLNDYEIDLYFKTTKCAIRHPILKERLKQKTSLLDEYNPTTAQRMFHLCNDLNFPLLSFETNKLSSRTVQKQIKIIKKMCSDFIKLNEYEKVIWLKNWLMSNKTQQARRMSITSRIKHCYPIYMWIVNRTNKLKDVKSLVQLAFHIVENMSDIPRCEVCKKQLNPDKFNCRLLCYPLTCSHTCNNKCLKLIDKRLLNNSTNSNGYKTNIGKNELCILKLIEYSFQLCLQHNIKVGPYFADGVDNNKRIIVEVQEKHHAQKKNFIKDVKRVLFFISQGYKVILVLDDWSRTKKSQLREKYKNLFENMPNVRVLDINLPKETVLTSSGWSSYIGIKKTPAKLPAVTIQTKHKKLTTTLDHLIGVIGQENNKKFIEAQKLKVGDIVDTIDGPGEICCIKQHNHTTFYDVIETDNHDFYANGIKVHNCIALDEAAYIESGILSDFWSSVIPAISSGRKSKILMVSTPNGVNNKFYDIFSGAENGKLKEWKAERIDWWEVPGRDENWKKTMIEVLGSEEKFLQEFGNAFLDSGACAIGATVIERFKSSKKKPVWVSEDQEYIVFQYPQKNHLYAIGVDVGEGIGRASSVAQVLDITDLQSIEQVAVYGSSVIEPYHFANKLNTIGHSWGIAPMLIERNNCGAQVIDALYYNHNYEKLVSYNKISEKDKYNSTRNIGVLSHTNIRFDGVQNMRYWVNHLQCVHINDPTTITEFETFIRQSNGIYKKRNENFFDDRIMALVWALFILDPDICENYFTINDYDNQNKPQNVSMLDYWEVTDGNYNLKDLQTNNDIIKKTQPDLSPVQTSSFFEADYKYGGPDLEDLMEMGYQMFTNNE